MRRKFNLRLFETFLLDFEYVHSKQKVEYLYPLSETPIYLSKQSKFVTNSPISFILNF